VPVPFDSLRCHGAILTVAILQAEGKILRADRQPSAGHGSKIGQMRSSVTKDAAPGHKSDGKEIASLS